MSEKSGGGLTLLITAAAVLGVIDSIIPKPMPFLRLGLANIPSVVCVFVMGYRETLELNCLRSIAVGLVTGTAATPTFLLSLSGAVTSATVMWLLHRIFPRQLSHAGISISGAVSSIWAQLIAAGLLLNDIPLAKLVPFLTLWAAVSGSAVGLAARRAEGFLKGNTVLRSEHR